ncbi:Bifunctional DNA primase/polymerase [Micromonospora sp. L5]|uniref:bifunctional DNA primase/polymerase n=1 Tax=Micromonospora sp. (strain L5) TaxID=648999 RepID=UPI0001C45C95|nr:bifunctional DNA primase/polymerase [Micromonospora sp. L5]ADU06411.1 Bifunctional DNA primase/polymerase [Micromonospora sp. L5]
MGTPYKVAAAAYADEDPNFWRPIPLPPGKKSPVPDAVTGWSNPQPSREQVEEWVTSGRFTVDPKNGVKLRAGNIALRLGHGLIGVDVDAYDDKPGAETFKVLQERLGDLPPTWRSSSRDDGISGIYLFRCRPGRRRGSPAPEDGGGIEFVQYGHRYVICAPSLHPSGRQYVWFSPDGEALEDEAPDPEELPWLPEAWDRYLMRDDPVVGEDAPELPDAEVAGWIAEDSAEPCAQMARLITKTAGELALRGSSGAHDITRDGLWQAIRDSAQGHRGLETAVAIFRKQFLAEVTGGSGKARRESTGQAETEFTRLLNPAVSKTIHELGARVEEDWCELLGSSNEPSGDDDDSGSAVLRLVQDMENRHQAKKLFDSKRYKELLSLSKRSRRMTGAEFLTELGEGLPTIWGEDQKVLWITGEALLIVGGDGVGKTTTLQQLILARLGLGDELWDLPVVPLEGRGLYLAMDRPAQAARSLGRMVREEDRPTLAERLEVWNGPLPVDIMGSPSAMADWIRAEFGEGISDVYVDSYKDLAASLSDDATGSGLNMAMQEVLARGMNWVGLHHQRKANGQNKTPNELSDVYGSRWITAGVGSVVFLDGQAGSEEVEVKHLKQPLAKVGPLMVSHSHSLGRSETVTPKMTADTALRAGPREGMTVKQVVKRIYGGARVESEAVEGKIRRQLDAMVKAERAVKIPGKKGGPSGSTAAVYQYVREPGEADG